ncbi:hypothetical protein C1H46_004272 [Malus baccata]|uniref:Secreted protein n=1 Tax=Malus baccata TaxID=106549 RepID=A0A540NGD6_MALBA|nr:hypothetical protein C1H46_004272 [Malus baccata]
MICCVRAHAALAAISFLFVAFCFSHCRAAKWQPPNSCADPVLTCCQSSLHVLCPQGFRALTSWFPLPQGSSPTPKLLYVLTFSFPRTDHNFPVLTSLPTSLPLSASVSLTSLPKGSLIISVSPFPCLPPSEAHFYLYLFLWFAIHALFFPSTTFSSAHLTSYCCQSAIHCIFCSIPAPSPTLPPLILRASTISSFWPSCLLLYFFYSFSSCKAAFFSLCTCLASHFLQLQRQPFLTLWIQEKSRGPFGNKRKI